MYVLPYAAASLPSALLLPSIRPSASTRSPIHPSIRPSVLPLPSHPTSYHPCSYRPSLPPPPPPPPLHFFLLFTLLLPLFLSLSVDTPPQLPTQSASCGPSPRIPSLAAPPHPPSVGDRPVPVMSIAPQAIHSNLSRPHPTDSRLLQNLIKGEKAYIDNLASSSASAHAAASALAAWGTSEAPDIARASQTLAEILTSVADAERTHVQALEGYRGALKDVLDREQSIRSVVRDRDILVGRLIKASKKKVSKKDYGMSYDEKNEKVMAAQRELHACEQVLASEEAALVGVKRRTFKEALTMRMKTLGDAGAAMVDAAKEAILLLDEFDTHGPLLQASGGGQYESMYADEGVEHGDYDEHPSPSPAGNGTGLIPDGHGGFHKSLQDHREMDPRFSQQFEMASVTPSQSASQVVHNERNVVPLGRRYSSQFAEVAEQEGTPSETDSETDYRRVFVEPRMNLPAPHEFGIAAETQDSFIPHSATTKRSNTHKSKKESGRRSRAEQAQQVPSLPTKDVAPPVPMPPVPSAPRLDVSQARNFGHIPTAPPAQTGLDEDTSDDEAQPKRSRSTWGPRPGRVSYQGAGRGPANGSDDGISYSVKRTDSIFGRVGKLFKTDLRDAPVRQRESSWDSRTDRRLQMQDNQRRSMIRRPEPESSDDEPDPRTLIRHVNNPKPLWGRETSSDVGVKGKFLRMPNTTIITPGPLSNRAQRDEEQRLAVIRASVVGNGFAGRVIKPAVGGESANIHYAATGTKKKTKKKKARTAGSETGTAPTRTATDVAPALSSQKVGAEGGSSAKGAAPASLSRSSTLQGPVSKKKKRSSTLISGGPDATAASPLTAFTPYGSKYSTATWVGKPASQMTAAEAVTMAGVVPNAPASRLQSTTTHSPNPDPTQPSSRPASVRSSASKSAPLKPALKPTSLSRATSNASTLSPKKAKGAAAASSSLRHDATASLVVPPPPQLEQPQMTPVPTAPAPLMLIQTPAAQPDETVAAPATQPTTEVKMPTNPSDSVPRLGTDETIDGTGHLDVPVRREAEVDPQPASVAPASGAGTETTAVKTLMPKLDMPNSEPFKIDLENLSRAELQRRGSALTEASEPFMTPSAEETYRAFVREDEANPAPIQPEVVQPAAVTRITDRKVVLQPSRVYASGAPELSDTSSEEGSASTDQPTHVADAGDSPAAVRAAQVQAATALTDPQDHTDPALSGLSSPAAAAPALSGASIAPQLCPLPDAAAAKEGGLLTVSSNNVASDVSDSGISRRKSVRMAPDVKLPPDTPTEEMATPRGNEYGGQDPLATRSGPNHVAASMLSSRIAPPPAAPACASSKVDGPIDLGANRERTGWTTRIRDQPADSSSDEDDDEDDEYSLARKAFGTASRGWSEATGSVRSKAKAATGAASVRSKASTSSKKKAKRATATSAFAPDVSSDGAAMGAGTGKASAPTQPSPSMYTVSAPAPLSLLDERLSQAPGTAAGGYMTSADLKSTKQQGGPVMPPVPLAPGGSNGGGGNAISVPNAPPATESIGRSKGFFGKFKKFK
ncbi:hypothetical protein ACQY0O_007946 [Thecaphora frezii]